jgi:hypothetical protein
LQLLRDQPSEPLLQRAVPLAHALQVLLLAVDQLPRDASPGVVGRGLALVQPAHFKRVPRLHARELGRQRGAQLLVDVVAREPVLHHAQQLGRVRYERELGARDEPAPVAADGQEELHLVLVVAVADLAVLGPRARGGLLVPREEVPVPPDVAGEGLPRGQTEPHHRSH